MGAEQHCHARYQGQVSAGKARLDKLGVKPLDLVSVLGVDEPGFVAELEARGARVTAGAAAPDSDVIFLGAESVVDLDQLAALRAYLKPAGGVWVVAPRGVQRIREADVLAAGKPAGLVDVKVARFSATHTAHKFVIPRAQRVRR